jgi:hypothetical protein
LVVFSQQRVKKGQSVLQTFLSWPVNSGRGGGLPFFRAYLMSSAVSNSGSAISGLYLTTNSLWAWFALYS